MTIADTTISSQKFYTIEDAIAGLEAHLGQEHTNLVRSAHELDVIARDILYNSVLALPPEEETNHILGLYGKAMEVLLDYHAQRKNDGDDRFMNYVKKINIRFEFLIRLGGGLPLVRDVDASPESILANIQLARSYLQPQS